jgi:glycosyltransferase involved in cell wall biosynthesis
VLPLTVPFLRRMDHHAAQTVDSFVAISETVRARIRDYYGRESEVVYPPVEVDRFRILSGPGSYYLAIGRHVAYKRMDVVVDAFNELGLPLKVAGVGEETPRLRARARPNVEFLGPVPDRDLPGLYGNAIALVFAAEEDFGIVPVEAMAAGRPVVAFGRGGARETVTEGVTGTFFAEQTPESLADAVARLRKMSFDPAEIRSRAARFGKERFRREMRERVAALIS